MQSAVTVTKEKRPNPFDDERPVNPKQLRLLEEAALPARSLSPSVTPTISVNDMVDKSYDTCFGMIYSTVSNLNLRDSRISRDPMIHLQYSIKNNMLTVHFGHHVGLLELQAAKTLGYVCERFKTVLDAYIPGINGKATDEKNRRQFSSKTCIIVYGMLQHIDAIGKIFSDARIFLQHPKNHDSSVPYDNPHYLVRPGGRLIIPDERKSSLRTNRSSDILAEDDPLKGHIDEVLDSVQGPQEYFKVSASRRLSTALKNYQVKALSMMIEKENGMIEGNQFGSLWTVHRLQNGQTRYKNVVTNAMRSAKPPLCLGGLLADEMGLGKTLTALALITTTLDKVVQTSSRCCTTLVVTPMSLLASWEEQIKRHIWDGAITWIVYHGSTKRTSLAFADYDIVLTTYDTIAAEMAATPNPNKRTTTSLMSYEWYRVVLDEAHFIRNASSARHNAILALKARHRWCLTGTPIFNRVEDLGSLLNFLRVHPFNSVSFSLHIARPLKKTPELGLAKLKSLVQAISLRRTKGSVFGDLQLAPRIDRVETVQLSQTERYFYNMIRKGFSQHLNHPAEKNKPPGYVFQTILRLRQFCNHGFDLFPSDTVRKFRDVKNYERLTLSLLERPEACTLCGGTITGEQVEEVARSYTTCGHRFCSSCVKQGLDDAMSQTQDCPACSGFQDSSHPDDQDGFPSAVADRSTYTPSSKVQALLRNLEAEVDAPTSGEAPKSVVLSSWTRMLDLLEIALKLNGFKFTRIDGSKSEPKRREALDQFRTHDDCRILLASLGSVGVGLDLTAASYIHLLEPLWSPMAEEQALDRVHRLGQTQQVVATRYLVQESIEEYVVSVQKAKTRVIKSSISESMSTETEKHMDHLMSYIVESPVDY